MTKKRVYELAKDLKIDTKDLLTHLNALGVKVRSHASTLEDSEVEKIKRYLRADEPHTVLEKRAKTTIVRKRVAIKREEAEVPVTSVSLQEPVEIKKVEPVIVPKKEEIKETAPFTPRVVPQRKEELHEKMVSPPSVPRPEVVTQKQEPISPTKEEKEEKKETLTAAAVEIVAPAPKEKTKEVERKVTDEKPKEVVGVKTLPKIIEEIKEVTPTSVEVEEGKKGLKKGRLELIEEPVTVKKKAFIKKIVEKKIWRVDTDFEDRPVKWKEPKKAAAPKMQKTVITVPKAIKRKVRIGEAISVGELAKRMGIKASELINKLISLGVLATINQTIDSETATLIAAEFGYQVETAELDYEEEIQQTETPPERLKPRAPVVTVMGHVDHGKTSLLDAIRKTNVTDAEAGGITQAIGAYHVRIDDRDIVFLDTPGHEAFTAMRARGAKVTDIVVLVVAADDGVKEQTIEAINHAREAKVPIIVAINKIDKPGADPGKVKQALTEYNLVPEEWGGDTIFCEISAKKRQGIEDLLSMILLQADIMELKADPDKKARGVVIEAKLDKGRGPVATVLVQEGTLREGDTFVSRSEFGRVRAMINDKGQRVKEAGPSMPIEVIGFSRVPQVGSEFICLDDEKKAKSLAEYWQRKEREKELSAHSKLTLEQLYQRIKEGTKDFNVIVKGDVQGSVEAIIEALGKLSSDEVRLKVIHSSTGAVTETDVMLASASNAIIIGFNVRPEPKVLELAEQEKVEIKLYDIIYDVIADMKAAMEGLLEPIYEQVTKGRAEIKQLFRVPKVGTVAGCYVLEGKVLRNGAIKLVRDGKVVYDGKIASLKRLKDDVREVAAGFECGIAIEGYNDLRVGDIIECYAREEVERKG